MLTRRYDAGPLRGGEDQCGLARIAFGDTGAWNAGLSTEKTMNVLFVLVPLALLLAGLGVWAFAWAVRRGQFDDVHTPAMRMLVDDEEDSEPGVGSSDLEKEGENDEGPHSRGLG